MSNVSVQAIIAAVKPRPEIWDSKHPDRANRGVGKRAWEETAAELNMREEELKVRWKHLKDHYRKELRRPKSKWRHFNLLGFLREEVSVPQRKTRWKRHVEYSEDDDDESAIVDVEEVPCDEKETEDIGKEDEPKKRRISDIAEEDFHYFMSVLPMMRRLDDAQRLRLRGRITHFLLTELKRNKQHGFC